MNRAIVLSSGGIDSTTCLAMAVKEYGAENVLSVSVLYGQKHDKEKECAVKIAEFYGVEHRVIDITDLGIFTGSTCTLLADNAEPVAQGTYAEQVSEGMSSIVSTYVPFRNGLMVSLIASLAMSVYPEDNVRIHLGVHRDDTLGHAYADCSYDFVRVMSDAIFMGTYGRVTVTAPLVRMSKAQVVAKGIELEAPYELTWSCYEGGETPCRACATCLDRAKAFEANGIDDPALA